PVAEITTPDAVLFLWSTCPKLDEAMQVIRGWGFRYRTMAVWAKDQIGMGYYFRQQTECLLLAVKGEPPVPLPENRPPSLFYAPRTDHSQKPEQAYDTIERMYPELRKIELFARGRPRAGWSVWGNQATEETR